MTPPPKVCKRNVDFLSFWGQEEEEEKEEEEEEEIEASKGEESSA